MSGYKFLPDDGYTVWPATVIGTVSVTNTSTQIAAEDKKRVELHLTNKGTERAWINFGAAAEVGKGSSIPPSGGEITVKILDLSDTWKIRAINGIVASGSTDIAILSQSAP